MTALPTQVDPKREINAAFRADVSYFQEKEDQISALGTEVALTRTSPCVWSFPMADPDGDALAPGTVVALLNHKAEAPAMVPFTDANILAGAQFLGILVETTPPGSMGRVAVAGVVRDVVTGWSGGEGIVGADPATGLVIRDPTRAIVGYAGADNSICIVPPGSDLIQAGSRDVALVTSASSQNLLLGEARTRWLRFTGSPASGCVVTVPFFFDGAFWFFENGTGVTLNIHTSGSNVALASGAVKQLVHKSVLRTIATVT